MKAVNLLPSDLSDTAPGASAGPGREPARGIGAFVVLGALALCVAALAGYVLASNTVEQRKGELADTRARADATSRTAAELKPYAAFESLAKARVETVRGLAAARFDWEQALRDLSRAVPGDVKLTTLIGDMGLPGAAGEADPLRSAIQAPAITLAGCAPTQSKVARMMARVRAVDGVTRVSVSKSDAGTRNSPSDTPCGVGRPSFSVIAFFENSAAAAALVPSSQSESSVPVPDAVAGEQDEENDAAAGSGTQAQDQPQNSSSPAPSSQGGTP
jgi:Tfp pilus assembly protein PilN